MIGWRGREKAISLTVVVPRSPLAALPEEIEAIVAYAKVHPREGYRRLAWTMVDSVREEAFGDGEAEDPHRARDLLEQWVSYYNEERLHSAPNYLRPVDYYKGNPEAVLAERKRKLKAAALRRKEVNRLTDLVKTRAGGIILARSICPKMTEALHMAP